MVNYRNVNARSLKIYLAEGLIAINDRANLLVVPVAEFLRIQLPVACFVMLKHNLRPVSTGRLSKRWRALTMHSGGYVVPVPIATL